jgi:hypothetical protein
MNPTTIPGGLALAEQYLLRELDTPEARAVLVRLLAELEARVESRTVNPILKQGETWAFALVRDYIAPAPAPVTGP